MLDRESRLVLRGVQCEADAKGDKRATDAPTVKQSMRNSLGNVSRDVMADQEELFAAVSSDVVARSGRVAKIFAEITEGRGRPFALTGYCTTPRRRNSACFVRS
jgi:hypothetical protein